MLRDGGTVGDLARAVSRIALGRGGPRDMLVIGQGLEAGEQLCASFAKTSAQELPRNLTDALAGLSLTRQPDLAALMGDIKKAFLPDAPMLTRDGNFVAQGWHAGLDELKKLRDDSRRIVAGLQADYAKLSGVSTLKVKHNNVLGYFIEVTPKHADVMLGAGADSPFIHRQTLVSGVRFTTTELADLDARISGAADKAVALELGIFTEFARRVSDMAEEVRRAAGGFAALDVQSALAHWAEDTNACRPVMDTSPALEIEGGRHPVVETALKSSGEGAFTANDCKLDGEGKGAALLT